MITNEKVAQHLLYTRARTRLHHALRQAPTIPFDDSSRLVFFSDLHRGDGRRGDRFAPNKQLFITALDYYMAEDFTYVEVGDGDELWRHRSLRPVVQAHAEVFERLRQLHRQQRLHLIVGNHDVGDRKLGCPAKEEIPVAPAVIFRHQDTGQPVYVLHGHQADIRCDDLAAISRFFVRWFWQPIVHLLENSGRPSHGVDTSIGLFTLWVTEMLRRWAAQLRALLICGHTHQAAFPEGENSFYSNTGSGLRPGHLTGIELVAGQITPIMWRQAGGGQRQPTGPTRPLSAFA